jgi:hypothetical protein
MTVQSHTHDSKQISTAAAALRGAPLHADLRAAFRLP